MPLRDVLAHAALTPRELSSRSGLAYSMVTRVLKGERHLGPRGATRVREVLQQAGVDQALIDGSVPPPVEAGQHVINIRRMSAALYRCIKRYCADSRLGHREVLIEPFVLAAPASPVQAILAVLAWCEDRNLATVEFTRRHVPGAALLARRPEGQQGKPVAMTISCVTDDEYRTCRLAVAYEGVALALLLQRTFSAAFPVAPGDLLKAARAEAALDPGLASRLEKARYE